MKCFITAYLLVLIFGCSREPVQPPTHCWQLVDPAGNNLQTVCGKTEDALIHCSTCGTFNGTTTFNLQPCDYYCTDCGIPTYCWYVNNSFHIADQTEKWMDCWYPSATKVKVDCDYTCGQWYVRRKMTYKPNNSTLYSYVAPKREYCGDTARIFFGATPFTVKDDADSLIVLQRSIDGTAWQ